MISRDLILDISVNLARVSDWVLSDSLVKQKRVDNFLEETRHFVLQLLDKEISSGFQPTLNRFRKEFDALLKDRKNNDKEEWAERALTWANILQHRSRLA